jgi:hypothetical protein|tara:strand:- start:876 stop:1331 length:456 start_codon:yes stop_codon:yes gene_type:complete
MANTQAMCTSFKSEILTGTHNFGVAPIRAATTADTFKAALYLASGSQGAATTAYAVTNEVTGTNYTAGGVSVTNATVPTTSGTTAYWTPSASITYTNVTLTTAFDCVLIYNSTQSNKAVSVHTFGSQTVTAGTFSLTMPTNGAGTALLNIA